MRIWYQDQWLVTGRDVDDIAPLDPIEFGGKQAVQVQPYLRSAVVVPYARGNREALFRLKTIQQCASYEEAMRLAADAPQSVPTSGELRIELDDDSTITSDGAAFVGCTPERVGVTLMLTWEFTLATWVIVDPTPSIWDGRNYFTLPSEIRDGGNYSDLNLITPLLVNGGGY